MEPKAIDWGGLAPHILGRGEGRERARALWEACLEVVSHPHAYHPLECDACPPLLEHLRLVDITQYRIRAEEGQDQVGKNVVRAYSFWRHHVTEVEAANAARLYTLAATLRTLAELRSLATDPEMVRSQIRQLSRFLESSWGVAIPIAGDLRTWAAKVTRRYDLLPATHREA